MPKPNTGMEAPVFSFNVAEEFFNVAGMVDYYLWVYLRPDYIAKLLYYHFRKEKGFTELNCNQIGNCVLYSFLFPFFSKLRKSYLNTHVMKSDNSISENDFMMSE